MRSRWLTRRALLATTAIVIWAPGCLIAGWWQATVALSGNDLGYLYAVEWPVFAVLGVVVWWQLVHDDPELVGARGLARLRAATARGGGDAGTPAGTPAATDAAAAACPGPSPKEEAAGAVATALQADAAGEVAAGGLPAATGGPDGPGPLSGYELELAEYNAYLASLRDRPKTWARR